MDIFHLARSLAFLAPIVDTQYGSATFVSARQPTAVELRVSTSGLLFRPLSGSTQPLSDRDHRRTRRRITLPFFVSRRSWENSG